ncbi:hypothetical protein SAMN04488238_106207 [Roseicitreum antarcticum]|uniref:Uncharacterized protein n=1 Tax=Roseicitreum antarcticum TaxID=564137 RepID=A0A1H3A607_9RHOB|nr:hypothetical protein SAMN04488238_106207 [Roseicitreum antarcticum]
MAELAAVHCIGRRLMRCATAPPRGPLIQHRPGRQLLPRSGHNLARHRYRRAMALPTRAIVGIGVRRPLQTVRHSSADEGLFHHIFRRVAVGTFAQPEAFQDRLHVGVEPERAANHAAVRPGCDRRQP